MMLVQRGLPGILAGEGRQLSAREQLRMKGFVPTPPELVDLMVKKLFAGGAPRPDRLVLDPGCGTGAFLGGILRWCAAHQAAVPHVVGVESDDRHLAAARSVVAGHGTVAVEHRDFLADDSRRFDYVVGNPPYVAITRLSEREKHAYRRRYETAVGRFDLYILFFEQALRQLRPGGRLVFITPEKFLYVKTAEPLRRLLAALYVEEIELVDEEVFPGLVTYPTITTVERRPANKPTRVVLRDGSVRDVSLPNDGASWLPRILNEESSASEATTTLGDVCVRVSCGVATGADEVFVHAERDVPPSLRPFAHPTVSGRELNGAAVQPPSRYVMLVPYDRHGQLLPFDRLGALGRFLARPETRTHLEQRTCVRHKPWYAFHENPPLPDILRPKILCKDIGRTSRFWVEERGDIVPRHSVYYIVPTDPAMVRPLAEYLNSAAAQAWLAGHCQRAASGFLRLQSSILRQLPLPPGLVPDERPRRAGLNGEAVAAEA
jgi:SAM-dependent methyltransferase